MIAAIMPSTTWKTVFSGVNRVDRRPFSISKCTLLWSGNTVLQQATDWLRIPDETTLGRLLKEVDTRRVSEYVALTSTLIIINKPLFLHHPFHFE